MARGGRAGGEARGRGRRGGKGEGQEVEVNGRDKDKIGKDLMIDCAAHQKALSRLPLPSPVGP